MDSAIDFLSWTFQRCETGNVNFRFIKGEKISNEFIPLASIYDDPRKVSSILEGHKNDNCFFGVALREGTNGRKDGISEIPSLWIDLDGSPVDQLTETPLAPSALIETSPGKYHAYWKLREPASRSDIPAIENILKRLASEFGGDRAATDASRILRVPDTLNFKLSPPFTVKVHSLTDIEYNFSDFDDLPEIHEQETTRAPTKDGDRLKAILDCKFLQHCDTDRASLPEPEWYGMISILARETGGRELIHSLSRGYPKYSSHETDQKILHSLNAGPLSCQKIKALWNCGQSCAVVTPIALAFKKKPAENATVCEFPRHTIGGLAGEFADLYSEYLESPWSFFAFSFLTCLGGIVADKVTLASEISPQPRLYTVNLGESGDDRKSESIKKTLEFFESTMARGEFRVCHGVGSAEGLAKRLEEIEEGSKKLVLVYDELKSFVGKAMIEGATLLPAVNSFFEGNKFHSATKTHSIELNNVFLSLLAASTIETFSRMWTPAFLDIGFLNRLWLIKDHGERRFSIPKEIPYEELKTLQRKLGDLLKMYPSAIKLQITDEARAIFDQWYFSIKPSPFTKRLDVYGLRLMILLAVNEGKLVVTKEIALNVVELLQWQLEIRREVDPIDAETSIARTEEMIRRALSSGPLNKRDLQRKINYARAGIFVWTSATRNLLSAQEIFYDHKNGLYRGGK